MLRTSFAALALTLSVATSALAQDYADAAHNFHLTVPDGWLTDLDNEKVISVFLLSPRMQETQGGCAVIAEADEQTKGLTQADIDAGIGAQFGDLFWTQSLSSDSELTAFTIESSGAEQVNGVRRYFAQIKSSMRSASGETVNNRSRQMLSFVPGWSYVLVCSALADKYEAEEADFKIVFASFAPLTSTPVASNAAGTRSLTLYSESGFGGVSRIVTQDTPNLALFGWRGQAASASVAGGGAWQVCDAADYRGSCRVVSGTLGDGIGLAGAVLSVRRATPAARGSALLRASLRSLVSKH